MKPVGSLFEFCFVILPVGSGPYRIFNTLGLPALRSIQKLLIAIDEHIVVIDAAVDTVPHSLVKINLRKCVLRPLQNI